jgi:hypothetical protein
MEALIREKSCDVKERGIHVRVCDLHATLLYARGLDRRKLTYPHEGRDDSLTDMSVTNANPVHTLLS